MLTFDTGEQGVDPVVHHLPHGRTHGMCGNRSRPSSGSRLNSLYLQVTRPEMQSDMHAEALMEGSVRSRRSFCSR